MRSVCRQLLPWQGFHRVSAPAKKSVFFFSIPRRNTIWDPQVLLLPPPSLSSFSTGDKGPSLPVAPDGTAKLLYSTTKRNIAFLAFDPRGNLSHRRHRTQRPQSRISKIYSKRHERIQPQHPKKPRLRPLRTSKREVTSPGRRCRWHIYFSAHWREAATGQASTTIISTPQGRRLYFQRHNRWRPGPATTHPSSLSPTLQQVFTHGSDARPKRLDLARRYRPTALGISSDAGSLAGTGNSRSAPHHRLTRCLRAISPSPVPRQSPSNRLVFLQAKFCLCTANPGKVLFRWPRVSKAEGTFRSRSFATRASFSSRKWGRIEWWKVLRRREGTSHSQRTAPLNFFYARNTEDPGREGASRWYGPYAKSGARWKRALRRGLHSGRPSSTMDARATASIGSRPSRICRQRSAPFNRGIVLQVSWRVATEPTVISAGASRNVTLRCRLRPIFPAW